MYHQNPRVRDAQNPYRTGVLIGNCWEDKFGMELATQPVSISPFQGHIAPMVFATFSEQVTHLSLLLTERWQDWHQREQGEPEPGFIFGSL